MADSLKQKLVRHDLLIGTIVTLSSPEVTEIFGQSGLDWLFVDLEHSTLDVKDAQIILQASLPQCPCVLRVPLNNEIWVKKVLDIGAPGVIIPLVRTADDARHAVRLCKYPPEGSRSVGVARAHGYGQTFQEYVQSANDDIAVILQIEHIDAVHNLEDILDVPNIDCLFVGPYDLSASMGKTGQVDDPEVLAAIEKVTQLAMQANVPLGIFGVTPEAVKAYIDRGYTLIAVGMDTLLLGNAAKDISSQFK